MRARIFLVSLFKPTTFFRSCYSELPDSLLNKCYAYRLSIDDMDYCVNCRIAIGRSYCIGRRVLVDEGILSVFRQWRTLQSVSFTHFPPIEVLLLANHVDVMSIGCVNGQ